MKNLKYILCRANLLGLLLVSFVYSENVTQLVNKLMPAVVTVATETGIGSGFIIDRDGYIFTNTHVVSKLWDTTEEIEDPLMASKERITIILKNGHKFESNRIVVAPFANQTGDSEHNQIGFIAHSINRRS